MLEIKKYPDPILLKKAEPIKEVGPAVWELIRQMKETLKQGQNGEIRGVGLAAPQIGVSKRVIIVLVKKQLKGFINPEIINQSRQKRIDKEGCFSFPGLWLDIKRPRTVKVKALDENGQKIELEIDGFFAGVFHHEIDHLNGILFYERLPFLKRWSVRRKLKSHSTAT